MVVPLHCGANIVFDTTVIDEYQCKRKRSDRKDEAEQNIDLNEVIADERNGKTSDVCAAAGTFG